MRKLIISLLIIAGVGVILVCILGYLAMRFVISNIVQSIQGELIERASEAPVPKVVIGKGLFKRDVFYQNGRLGSVTDIVYGELDPSEGPEIAIVGNRGAAFLTERGKLKNFVVYDTFNTDYVNAVDIEGDGICEFLNRGSWSTPVLLMSHNGKVLWRYSGFGGVDDATVGDLNGDGICEVVVGFNGGGGVHLVNSKGKRLWRRRDGNVWHVEVTDTDGDGALEIVHSNAGGVITIRDKNGNIIRRSRPPIYFSTFSLITWNARRQYALVAKRNKILVLDFDATVVAEFEAPSCGKFGYPKGTWFGGPTSSARCFATLVNHKTSHAILYIYDANGKLIYHEVFPTECASLMAFKPAGSETEELLIGTEGKVWRYTYSSESM